MYILERLPTLCTSHLFFNEIKFLIYKPIWELLSFKDLFFSSYNCGCAINRSTRFHWIFYMIGGISEPMEMLSISISHCFARLSRLTRNQTAISQPTPFYTIRIEI